VNFVHTLSRLCTLVTLAIRLLSRRRTICQGWSYLLERRLLGYWDNHGQTKIIIICYISPNSPTLILRGCCLLQIASLPVLPCRSTRHQPTHRRASTAPPSNLKPSSSASFTPHKPTPQQYLGPVISMVITETANTQFIWLVSRGRVHLSACRAQRGDV